MFWTRKNGEPLDPVVEEIVTVNNGVVIAYPPEMDTISEYEFDIYWEAEGGYGLRLEEPNQLIIGCDETIIEPIIVSGLDELDSGIITLYLQDTNIDEAGIYEL